MRNKQSQCQCQCLVLISGSFSWFLFQGSQFILLTGLPWKRLPSSYRLTNRSIRKLDLSLKGPLDQLIDTSYTGTLMKRFLRPPQLLRRPQRHGYRQPGDPIAAWTGSKIEKWGWGVGTDVRFELDLTSVSNSIWRSISTSIWRLVSNWILTIWRPFRVQFNFWIKPERWLGNLFWCD